MTTQLNRLCRQHLHRSALDVPHQRLLLEPKRELGYTTLLVARSPPGCALGTLPVSRASCGG